MDIFGKNPLDYAMLRHVKEEAPDEFETYLMEAPGDHAWSGPHDFGALGKHKEDGGALNTVLMEDAAIVGYITDNLQAIQDMIQEVLYTEFRLDEWVPIKTNVPAAARTYAYRVTDQRGRGRFIDHAGSNVQRATTNIRNVPYVMALGGLDAYWTKEDLRQAMFGGVPLDEMEVRAATRGSMDHIETVGLMGDTDLPGSKGLINQPTTGNNKVNHVNETTQITGAMTGKDLVALLDKHVNSLVSSSKEVFGRTINTGLSIYLPHTQAAAVWSVEMPDTAVSAWEYFATHNYWYRLTGETPTLHSVTELESAGASSKDRMIIALNNEEVMEMAIPELPHALGVYDEKREVCVPVDYKCSALNVKRPGGISYVDNI